ncbi:hypothetical protein [Marinitoga sp. 38H-ov]|uniref:hypothetical protein n=1 Tax=Marinitoga sp. 38H-ov TaxID=1755814 RepID=UPI0013EC4F2E|nr:hypothetical protein [Marinitoga sp. 38H-ov]KAF2956024.1 hypothetical protein AS160_07630 [Marinitoga sp. 38H-ov]
MLNYIFKIIFSPRKVKSAPFYNIYVGIIILLFFWFSPLFSNLTIYGFFKKTLLIVSLIFVNNGIRTSFYDIKDFRNVFPYYILSSSPLLFIGFFSILIKYSFHYYFILPFIWMELLKIRIDIMHKKYFAIIFGIIIDTLVYLLLWR